MRLSLILPMPCLAHVGQITESIGVVVGLREGDVGADAGLGREIGVLAGVGGELAQGYDWL